MISNRGDDNPNSPPIRLKNLSIQAGTQQLLRRVTTTFEAGQVTLVIGPSGVGKTLLLRAMAAIGDEAGVNVSGRIEIGKRRARPGRIGVVFQDFALFDELSPEGNIQFAIAHAPDVEPAASNSDHDSSNAKLQNDRQAAADSSELDSTAVENEQAAESESLFDLANKSASTWMTELEVPLGTRLRHLSGGQRQRVAIARALASRPDALLYDEPTSGLDPQTADRVATLIRQTAQQRQQTTVIVTHDYRSLVPIADRILILDPVARTLRAIAKENWGALDVELEQSLKGRDKVSIPPRRSLTNRFTRAVGSSITRFFAGTTHLTVELLVLLLSLIPAWKSFRWGPYYLLHYLRLVAGPSAWLYLGVAGGILGFVATYFTFRFLPYASYTEPLLVDDLLGAMGFSLYRILVPILATILIAARCGAAVTSDIGGKRLGRQMEAMQSLRVPPRRYLLTGTLHAFLLGTPVLVGLAYFTASLTSMTIFLWIHPELGADYWRLHFHKELSIANQPFFEGTGWLIGKVLICALGIGLIAYRRGAAPKNSTSDVSRGVTSTILRATLFVLVVHFVFAFFEFKPLSASS